MLTVTPVTTWFFYNVFTILNILLFVMMTLVMLLLFVVSNDSLLPSNCIITNVSYIDATKIWNSNPYAGHLHIVTGTYSNDVVFSSIVLESGQVSFMLSWHFEISFKIYLEKTLNVYICLFFNSIS